MWIEAIWSNCLNKKYDNCVIVLLLAELVMNIEGLILHMHRHNSKEKNKTKWKQNYLAKQNTKCICPKSA